MSTTPGSGDEFDDAHTNSFATESAAAPEKKKASPIIKWVIILFGAFMVVASGLMLWGFIGGDSKPAPQAQNAPGGPVDPLAAPGADQNINPNAGLNDPAADPNAQDLGADPFADPSVLDPSAVPPNPLDPNGVAQDPNGQGQPSDPMTQILDANGVPVVAVDPTVAQPPVQQPPVQEIVDANGVPVSVDPNSTVVPPPAVEQAPAPTEIPPAQQIVDPAAPPAPVVVEDPANSTVSQVMDTARQEMLSAFNRIEQRLSDLESRFSSLETKVAAIEGRPASAAPAAAPAKPAARKPAARKPASRKPAVRRAAPKPAPQPQNRLEILDGSIAPVSRVLIVDRSSQAPAYDNRVQIVSTQAPSRIERPSSGCSIQSIKPGRVWVRRADGSFATYGVGDMLPNGRRADSIDPDSGVQSGGQLWTCD